MGLCQPRKRSCRAGGLLHLVLRTLDEHVGVAGAGGDHGEHIVFLDHLGFDHHGTVVVVHGPLQDLVHIRWALDALGGNIEGSWRA